MSDVGINPDTRNEQMQRFYSIAEKYSTSEAILEENIKGDYVTECELSRVDAVEETLKRKKK